MLNSQITPIKQPVIIIFITKSLYISNNSQIDWHCLIIHYSFKYYPREKWSTKTKKSQHLLTIIKQSSSLKYINDVLFCCPESLQIMWSTNICDVFMLTWHTNIRALYHKHCYYKYQNWPVSFNITLPDCESAR